MAKSKTEFLIGTSGWMYDAWRGPFYPDDLAKTRWLSFYTCHFDTLEMNATFYRFFKEENYIKWRDAVPTQFHYIMKVPRFITHYRLLKNCDDMTKRFLDLVHLMGPKLGLILLQLSPKQPYDLDRLAHAIELFPQRKQLVVEFRDPKWLTKETEQLLTEEGCIYCDADSPESELNGWLTTDIAYIRMHGRTRWYNYQYTKKQLDEVVQHAKKLARKGAKKIYILFNNDWEAFAIKNALYLKQVLKSS